MAVLIILIAVFLMLLLQRKIYQRFWNWHLAAGISFSEKEITEGEAVVIEEELTNDKILPLPWVHLKFQVKANGQTAFFESELFHILFHQRIRLKRERMVSKRGIYQISDVDLISYDLFLTTKLIDMENDTMRHLWTSQRNFMMTDFFPSLLWLHSVYALGGTFFRSHKYAALLTTAAVIVLGLLHVWLFGMEDLYDENKPSDTVDIIWCTFYGILTIVNFWLSYRLFCRNQVIGRFVNL